MDLIQDTMKWLAAGGNGSFAKFFADALRANLFAGFLTLCAFLYSVKTFLLVTLQKDVYGTKEYGERIERLRQVNTGLTRYGQLRRLNRTIFWAVLLTFIAACAQLTVGLVEQNWAAIVCVAVSVVAGSVVAYNLIVQRIVIDDWLEYIEDLPNKN